MHAVWEATSWELSSGFRLIFFKKIIKIKKKNMDKEDLNSQTNQ